MTTSPLNAFLVSGLLGLATTAGTATAAIIFSENFTNPATASARFDVTRINGPWGADVTFETGDVRMDDYQGRATLIRTNAANNFTENGTLPVTYSVIESLTTEVGARNALLYVRMGETDYSDGYVLSHYNDGTSTFLNFSRLNAGAGTSLYGSGTQAVFNNTDPVTMAVTLANNLDGSVTYTLQYSTFSYTGTDTAANAITSGKGIGVGFNNNGSPTWLSGTFDDLTVTTIPEPAALALLGLAGLALAGRRQRR